MIHVVSSIMGGYDAIRPWPEQSVEYQRWVYTDQAGHPWEIDRYSTAMPLHRLHLHPRMAAKLPKCLPHTFVNPDLDDTIVWVDGSIYPRSMGFLEWLVENSDYYLSQFRHHDRPDGSLWQEYEASEWQGKYKDQPMQEQLQYYFSKGLDMHPGVWATGLIVYTADHESGWGWLDSFGGSWLTEQARWSYQDQLSEPYVLWQQGLAPAPIPGAIIGNSYFDLTPHASDH